MNEQPHIDYDGLAAFIAGELHGSDHDRWVEWIAASPENERLYKECLLLFTPDIPEHQAQAYDSKAAWKLVEERRKPVEIQMHGEAFSGTLVKWWRYAAVLILGGLLITYLIRTSGTQRTEISQSSGIATYVLPDSSTVTLNGASRIAYDEGYFRTNRDITLEGKAYFDVRKIDSLSFNVSTDRGLLTVLGTAFLIEETTDSLYVIVERGRVEVGLKDQREKLELTRNETGIIQFTTGELKEYEVTTLNSLYWANKRLTYRQTSLADVLDEIAQLFDKEIIYDRKSLDSCRITAIFRDQNFEEIMENIELSFPIKYTINGDRVEITSNGCSSN